MTKALYLFVTSERPDPYINAIAHCLLHKAVDRIVFVHVRGASGNAPEPDLSAAALRNVQIQLDRLAHGEYRYFEGDDADQTVSLERAYTLEALTALRAFYVDCLAKEANWSHRQIAYGALREELAQIQTREPHSLFDVTSVSKSLLGDIIAISILEGIETLYTLDLRMKPDFDEPWRMLLHDTGDTSGRKQRYAYVNIVDTPIFRSCAKSILVRGPRLIFPIAAAVVLLAAAVTDYLIRGEVTGFIQVTSIASGIAGLLSLVFNFWPIRR